MSEAARAPDAPVTFLEVLLRAGLPDHTPAIVAHLERDGEPVGDTGEGARGPGTGSCASPGRTHRENPSRPSS